jgi:phosphopantothenoylcysteine decarboxylase/phosphopantothenate--cysteine ligase
VVAPATTHTLAKLALGLGDDFLTTTALAFDGPLVLAPAMHPVMWDRETTREHVAALRGRGATFVGPVEGALASGESGVGRMAEPPQIADAVDGLGAQDGTSLRGRTVVVTAGPTHEAIDAVRVLANRSSGRMGFALAAAARQRGARVLLIAGPVALATPAGVERRDVLSAAEMREALYSAAPDADLVLMTAAVADFRPRRAVDGKLKRAELGPGFALELEPNPDLLAGLPAIAPRAVLVGFAAETRDLERQGAEKLRAKGCDFVVANDVSRPDIGFGADANEVTVLSRHDAPVFLSRRPKTSLASDLLDLFAPAILQRAHQPTAGVPR